MYFAVDPISHATFVEELLGRMTASAQAGATWWALLDRAFDHGGHPWKWRRASWPLYDRHPLDQLRAVSPVLLELATEPKEVREDLMRLATHCSGRPMLGFVQTTCTAQNLIDAWQDCIYPETEDGDRFLLRFADTRVASILPQTLAIAHWQLLTRLVRQWHVIGREGRLEALALPRDVGADASLPPKIRLSDAEVQGLMHSSMPDAVVAAMDEQCPGLLPTHQRAAFHGQVSAVHDLAHRQGVEAFPDILALAVACTLEPRLIHDPRLDELLRERRWHPGQLSALLVELMPEEAV